MKSMLRLEAAVLFLGWLSGLFFLFYSEGIFDGSPPWSAMDVVFIYYAAILAVPFVLAATFCWLLKRFVMLFMFGSIAMVAASTDAYYGEISNPQPDGGWVFLMIPVLQSIFVFVSSGFIFVLGKFVKQPPAPAVR